MNPGLLEVDPNDSAEVGLMLDLNEQLHNQVNGYFAANGVLVGAWPMTATFPPDDSWMDKHAEEHMVWAHILGVNDPGGLNQYNLRDSRQFAQWINLHALHHELISRALNLP